MAITDYDWIDKFNENIRRNDGKYNQREEIGISTLNSRRKKAEEDVTKEYAKSIEKYEYDRLRKKVYYEQHKEEILKRNAEYHRKNKDKIDARRRENAELRKAAKKQQKTS